MFSAGKLHLMDTIITGMFLSVIPAWFKAALHVSMKSGFQTVIKYQVFMRYCYIFIERQCGLREHSSYSPPARLLPCQILGLPVMNPHCPAIAQSSLQSWYRGIQESYSLHSRYLYFTWERRMNFCLFWVCNQMVLVIL